jgi:hypothetical protein
VIFQRQPAVEKRRSPGGRAGVLPARLKPLTARDVNTEQETRMHNAHRNRWNWIALALFALAAHVAAVDRQDIRLPDIPRYQTLKCDFHMHTVFSDGQVWPTWRVEEAWRDGLDAIALTDHIEYQPKKEDVLPRLQRPFEIAQDLGSERGVIVIRGAEITKAVPPGHFNALFLADITPLATNNLAVQMEEARKQDAFVFWNHPGWRVKVNEAVILPLHSELAAQKLVQGTELFNGSDLYSNVWSWALQNKLTLLANSDTHTPLDPPLANHAKHRTLTLVFAKERTADGIKEALRAGRTALWAGDILVGPGELLAPLFAAAVQVAPPHHRTAKVALLKITNHSDVPFNLTRKGGPGPTKLELPAGKTVLLKLTLAAKQPLPTLDYTVDNLLTAPNTPLPVTLTLPGTTPGK